MLRVYIVRHGETMFNVKHKIQGWCDSPLTKQGIQQAKNVGVNLKEIEFETCYCSTSERVIDTANLILTDRNVLIQPTKKLKEMNFGELEGESEEELLKVQHLFLSEGMRQFGGESMKDVTDRMNETLEMIANNHKDGNILLVSHGGAIMNLLCSIKPEIYDDLINHKTPGIANCSVSILEYDKKWQVIEYNNTTYREL